MVANAGFHIRALFAATMICRNCGYSLQGLATPVCPECATTFDPVDRRTYAAARASWVRRAVIVGISLLAVAWGAYGALYGRSQTFGISIGGIIDDLALQLLFASWLFPLILLPLFATDKRPQRPYRLLRLSAVILVSSIVLAEAWAGAQDIVFYSGHQRCPSTGTCTEGRWWPYRNHHIAHDPATRRWWGGD